MNLTDINIKYLSEELDGMDSLNIMDRLFEIHGKDDIEIVTTFKSLQGNYTISCYDKIMVLYCVIMNHKKTYEEALEYWDVYLHFIELEKKERLDVEYHGINIEINLRNKFLDNLDSYSEKYKLYTDLKTFLDGDI